LIYELTHFTHAVFRNVLTRHCKRLDLFFLAFSRRGSFQERGERRLRTPIRIR
jgi:hypothetical protein